MTYAKAVVLLAAVLMAPVSAAADVIDSTAHGFAVRMMPGGLAAIAPAVDAVLAEQLQRLKRFVETGRPE
jgi:hypothetical protein